jgi:cytochrome c oxidase subunit 3
MIKKENNLFDLLSEKPWEQKQSAQDNLHSGRTINLTKAHLGLRGIITVSIIFFSLFIVTYADRMLLHDWQKMPEPKLLWFNTFVLFISSVLFHWAKNKSDNQKFKEVKNLLLLIGFLAIIFFIGQLIAWKQLVEQGYFFNSNIANSYFYLFTTLHVLHLFGGLFFLKRITQKIFDRNSKLLAMQSGVKLCGIYWHFLFLVWLVLFGLMINS